MCNKPTRTRITLRVGLCICVAASLFVSFGSLWHSKRTVSPPPLIVVDLDGVVHEPGVTEDCKGIVYYFMGIECPISNGTISTMNDLVDEFSHQAIQFYGVIADRTVTRLEASRHRDDFQVSFPVIFDPSEHIRLRLQATHTPHAILTDADGQILYSGRVDDRYADLGVKRQGVRRRYLREALDAIVENQSIRVRQTQPIGCLMEPALAVQDMASAGERARANSNPITYARDIAPIMQAHCVVCHRQGDVAPFSLQTFTDVSRRARQIHNVTRSRLMPPWKPRADIAHFRDDRRLSNRQIQLIRNWIDSGKLFGNPDDLPPPQQFVDGWRMGTPDLILEMPESFAVQASGDDIYQYFVLPTGLTQDRLIRAFDFQPGTAAVVHHAGFWFDRTGQARRLDTRDPAVGYSSFGGPGIAGWIGLGHWTPGTSAQPLPEGTGRLIQANSDLVLQIHYHPTGKPERDRSRVGLYFARHSAKRLVDEIAVCDMSLQIPAGRARHRHVASYTLPVDTVLLDVYPHMHILGRSLDATAILPNGNRKPLVVIDDWSFGWQPRYQFKRPFRLPAGTRIELVCVYDNSAANPLNPFDPPQNIRWGEQSTEEMGMVFFQVLTDESYELAQLIHDNQTHYMRSLAKWYEMHGGDSPTVPPMVVYGDP